LDLYWEGPLKVSGTFQGKKVLGQGFLEFVGYSTSVGKVKMIEGEILKEIKNSSRFFTSLIF